MPIITISSNCPTKGQELASRLADKTGWPLLTRAQVVEQAQAQGIKIGRLEVSMIKAPVVREKLAREKELFLAFATAMICENVRDGNLIYQGRAGHLLLPGITHRIRVGLVVPKPVRVRNTMNQLSLSRDKALAYLDQLDEDIQRWMRYVHKVDLMDPKRYDLFINLQAISLSNTFAVLDHAARWPDFRLTSKSIRAMADLGLAAQARVRLGLDSRTRDADLGVRAADGVVTVTYMPRQEAVVASISEVLKNLEGCRKVRCTMAETNICWVAEKFSSDSKEFQLVIKLAHRWGAAVELIRLVPPGEGENGRTKRVIPFPTPVEQRADPHEYTGGVEYDDPEPENDDESGMSQALEELVTIGRSGGGQIVYGAKEEILHAIQGSGTYSLVVLGDIFLSRGLQARIRQTRELSLELRERVKAPVITASELHSRFTFGKKQAARFLLYAVVVAAVYLLVFSEQQAILDFLGGEAHQRWKWLSCAAVGLFIPFVAYAYSTVTGLILKMIGID